METVRNVYEVHNSELPYAMESRHRLIIGLGTFLDPRKAFDPANTPPAELDAN